MKKLYKEIWNKIIESKKITILTHVDPDGDTIGSAVALKHLILENSENIEVKISGEKVPKYLSLLNENDNVTDEYFNSSQVIVVDTSNKKRIFDKRAITIESIKIDHHHEEEEWLIGIGGDNWPATGQVIYELAVANKLIISKRSMEGIFMAIWTDTEGLTQRNITKRTIEILESLDVNKKELISSLEMPKEIKELIEKLKSKIVIQNNIGFLLFEEVIDNEFIRPITAELSNIKSFEVYIGILKTNKDSYRGSIRSKGNIDVSKYAKELGGGGHFTSAGFRGYDIKQINKIIENIKLELKNKI